MGGVEDIGRSVIICILVAFVIELFSNVFGLFPWALGIVNATNTAANEASTYNTFFKESRRALEQELSDLPQINATVGSEGQSDFIKQSLLAENWFPMYRNQIEQNMRGEATANDAEGNSGKQMTPGSILNIAGTNILKNSKVIMIEGHGYMGVEYSKIQNQNYDQSAVENKVATLYDYNTQFGNYLDPIDIYTFAVYPLRFGIGDSVGKVFLIPWVYHSGSVGLHLYRENAQSLS